MIEAKIEGHKVVETPTAHIAPVIDIMEALKKSLEQKKKPVGTAQSASPEPVEEPVPVKKRSGQRRAGGQG